MNISKNFIKGLKILFLTIPSKSKNVTEERVNFIFSSQSEIEKILKNFQKYIYETYKKGLLKCPYCEKKLSEENIIIIQHDLNLWYMCQESTCINNFYRRRVIEFISVSGAFK